MKVLLDTCTFLWLVDEQQHLSQTARTTIRDPECDVLLSAASVWETEVKYLLGKLDLAEPPALLIPKQRIAHGIDPLPIDETAAFQLEKLPPLHRDPFDRMLVCQAIAEGLAIVTPDPQIAQYPIRTIW